MKYLNLVFGFLALINVIYTFFSDAQTGRLFGMDINIWLYRLIWLALALAFFNSYRKRKNAEQK